MIHRVLSVQLTTVECDTEQILCVTLKTGQEVSKNTAELQEVKKKKQYFLFSQTGKTEHSNNDMMLSIKIHPKFTQTFYTACNFQSSQYKFTKYINHLDIFYTQSHTSYIQTFVIMWLSLLKNITVMYLAILLYITNLHCHLRV